MPENKNTEQGLRQHRREHLPKKVLNNEQNPHSFKDPLKKEQEKAARSQKQQADRNSQDREG